MIRKLLMITIGAAGLTVAAVIVVISGALFTIWPTGWFDAQIQMDAAATQQLQQLRKQTKFLPDTTLLYFGAPNDAIRIAAESSVNELLDSVTAATERDPRKSTILATLKRHLPSLDRFDSEERDRALLYMQDMLESFGIASSNDLLNVWRYGFPLNWFLSRKSSP